MKRVVIGLIVAAAALRWATTGTLARVSADDFGSLIGLLIAAIAWVAYGWLVLAVVATALERLPGTLGRAATKATAAITSEGTRTLLRSTLGVAATAPLTVAAAHASPQHAALDHQPIAGTAVAQAPLAHPSSDRNSVPESEAWDPRAGVERPSTVPVPRADVDPIRRTRSDPPGGPPRLAIPDRPTIGAETRYTPVVHPADQRTVVVRPGDSLWTIAARELGPDASKTAIDRRWPRWYAANAERIGPDPGLLHPGQRLRPPTDGRAANPDQEK